MQVNEMQPPRSKKDFILSRPDLSAKDIVAAAAQEGIDTTIAYVYVTRSEATKARRATNEKKVADTTSASKAQTREAEFLELVLDVGLARADTLLGKLRALGREITRYA